MSKNKYDVKTLNQDANLRRRATPASPNQGQRETVESIVVAVILAFLFRAFVAEAFVIPTGSMAPTLQGRHMDVVCEVCGYPYRTGASGENEGKHEEVVATVCPLCRYKMELDKEAKKNQRSFNGDRILVSKFAYEVGEPKRWDVIVFKYPGNAKQNYIKRLVGLPNETLSIYHGDIYTLSKDEQEAEQGAGRQRGPIARKPPHKLQAMLQVVDDTAYVASPLVREGWPARWQEWSSPQTPAWKPRADGRGFETAAVAEKDAWLRYRHVVPRDADWSDIVRGRIPQRLDNKKVQAQLISDYYAYNDGVIMMSRGGPDFLDRSALGTHWVGDLAVEAEVDVQGAKGELLLDLVEGGVHYTCRIDVATGIATLAIDGGRQRFVGDDGAKLLHPQASTTVRGPGRRHLRFSNCDDQLLLWVNQEVARFNGPTTYRPVENVKPKWSPQDPGDLEPAGIGAAGLPLVVSRLRVLRDVYYLAVSSEKGRQYEYTTPFSEGEIVDILESPQDWATTPLFDARRTDVQFELPADQFFPLGDNSPQSKDARLWSETDFQTGLTAPPHFVARDLLIGQALVIYWPHAWRSPIPFWPNFKRMGRIR